MDHTLPPPTDEDKARADRAHARAHADAKRRVEKRGHTMTTADTGALAQETGLLSLAGLYVALSELEDAGCVESRDRDEPPEALLIRGGRPRREYRLTKDGIRRRAATITKPLFGAMPSPARPDTRKARAG